MDCRAKIGVILMILPIGKPVYKPVHPPDRRLVFGSRAADSAKSKGSGESSSPVWSPARPSISFVTGKSKSASNIDSASVSKVQSSQDITEYWKLNSISYATSSVMRWSLMRLERFVLQTSLPQDPACHAVQSLERCRDRIKLKRIFRTPVRIYASEDCREMLHELL